MLKQLLIYPRWFWDEHSKLICLEAKARIIPADAWVHEIDVHNLILPMDFDLIAYAKANKIHVVLFNNEREDAYDGPRCHPDLLERLAKRTYRRLLRNPDKEWCRVLRPNLNFRGKPVH